MFKTSKGQISHKEYHASFSGRSFIFHLSYAVELSASWQQLSPLKIFFYSSLNGAGGVRVEAQGSRGRGQGPALRLRGGTSDQVHGV